MPLPYSSLNLIITSFIILDVELAGCAHSLWMLIIVKPKHRGAYKRRFEAFVFQLRLIVY